MGGQKRKLPAIWRPPPALSRCCRCLSDTGLTQPCKARGQQKIQSQQSNAKKQAGQKKKQGHDHSCTICKTQIPDPKTFKQHFESKHSKTPPPPELADIHAESCL
ncbi:PREDICTED: zinc finger protein 706-like [Chrysochloris asiatica]|uniref:Zinc finger protein 706-like n=1 Tax=Chrysochloris asiatica TaxID=185453 RepID=A0A9B0T7J9_CHRAS|nr:PREDICTED: zinc finger protein 706-like [Chrysochloris asiatica]